MDTSNFKEVFTSDETKQLRKRVNELEAENTRLSNLCDKWNSECDEYRVENKKLSEQLAAHEAVINQMREALEAAVAGMGGSYLIWSAKAKQVLTLQPTTEHLDAYVKAMLGEPVAWLCSDDALVRMGYKRVADTQFGDWNVPLYALKEHK